MSAIMETPADEMKRLIRAIGGAKMPGEADVHVRNRAQRRMNERLPRERHVSIRTAYSYWHGEKTDVPSHHMDVARALTRPAPTLDQQLSSIIASSQRLEHAEQERLAAALELIRHASIWRLLDRRRGVDPAFGGPDRRSSGGAVGGGLSAALDGEG